MYYFIENGFFIEELLNFRVEINFNRKMFFEKLKSYEFYSFYVIEVLIWFYFSLYLYLVQRVFDLV